MDYEKAYKEALKRAKGFKTDEYKDVAEYIFPELIESEDERIRKELIRVFSNREKYVVNQSFGDINVSDILAWLEKQGEQKSTWSEEDEQNYDIILKIICSSNKSENLVNELFDWFKSLKNRMQLEQKWNYNDEIIIETIIQEIEKIPSEKFIDNAKYRCLNWLRYRTKSLRSQNNNVTDEELAQAKKDAYNDALDKIEYHSGEPTFDDGWDAAIWYLKKRNIQLCHTWKPSDEQITLLYRAADDASKDSRMKQILNELLSDLKKLREE